VDEGQIGDARPEQMIRLSERTNAKGFQNADPESEVHPVTIPDTRRSELRPGHVWRRIQTDETFSWPHDYGRSTELKDR
jgi:hypothetical protein